MYYYLILGDSDFLGKFYIIGMVIYNLAESIGSNMMRVFRISAPMCSGMAAGAVSLKKPKKIAT